MRKVGSVANTTAVCGAQMLKDHARGRSSVVGQAHSELSENRERSDSDESYITLVGCVESSITRLEAAVAIAALTCCPKQGFDVGPAMPAFFRLAPTTVAVKSLSPNFPHGPLVTQFLPFGVKRWCIKQPCMMRFTEHRNIVLRTTDGMLCTYKTQRKGCLLYTSDAADE